MVVLFLYLNYIAGRELEESPCPQIFRYENISTNKWYGSVNYTVPITERKAFFDLKLSNSPKLITVIIHFLKIFYIYFYILGYYLVNLLFKTEDGFLKNSINEFILFFQFTCHVRLLGRRYGLEDSDFIEQFVDLEEGEEAMIIIRTRIYDIPLVCWKLILHTLRIVMSAFS